MSESMTMAPQTAVMLFEAATERGILDGRRAALLDRLEGMAEDLFPGGTNLFSSLMTVNAERGKCAGAECLRGIGDRFLRLRGFAPGELREDGRFYTPPRIIDRILDALWEAMFEGDRFRSAATRRICDPAMGCGFFHLRLLERMTERFRPDPDGLRSWAECCLYGVDKDPFAVFMSRALLWLCLSGEGGEFVPAREKFVCGDALLGNGFGRDNVPAAPGVGTAVDWEAAFPEVAGAGGFDVLFGNPPYEVLTNFRARPGSRRLSEAIRASGLYRDALDGQINLYRCFVERALGLVRPGGLLSMVVPLSLARDAAAKRLRRRLLAECRADRWLFYGEDEKAFPGVTQSACVFRAERDGGRAERLRIALGGAPFREITLADIEDFDPGGLSIPAVVPEALAVCRWLRRYASRVLSDAADSHVGEVDQTVFRECISDEPTGCLLVRGAHLSPFHLDIRPVPGKGRFLRLERFLEMKGGAAKICRARAARRRVVQLGIRNMQSRPRLVAALAPPGVYAGNSLNIFYPREGVSAEFLAGVLNSRLMDWLFHAGSGNNNINLHEMRDLPFPGSEDAGAVAAVESAYRRAEAAAAAENASEEDLSAGRMTLDRAVAVCYGLPEELFAGLLAVEGDAGRFRDALDGAEKT